MIEGPKGTGCFRAITLNIMNSIPIIAPIRHAKKMQAVLSAFQV